MPVSRRLRVPSAEALVHVRALATTFGLVCLTTGCASSGIKRFENTTISPREIDSTVSRLMPAAGVTGAAIALLNAGRVVYQKAYGFRDKANKLALTDSSVMWSASLTKAAFAYLVMRLVDQGILSLDKPVFEYLAEPLPDYPAYQDLAPDARYKRITARMLLSHTSGFPNWRFLTPERKLNINFEPGSRYAYSGEGINLLQLVVETITAKELSELMREQVFLPLGMSRTSMVWEQSFESDHASGHDEWERSLGPQKFDKPNAAGSMWTTVSDFGRFLAAVMRAEGLRSDTRDLMLSPQIRIRSTRQFPTLSPDTTRANDSIRLSYGLGWGLYWTPSAKAFFKEGHAPGSRNYAVGFDNGTGLVIMTNSSNGERIFKELLETVLGNRFTPIEWHGFTPYQLLPPRPPLKEHHEIVLDTTILNTYVGRYRDSATGTVLTVTRELGHLLIQEGDQAPQQIVPEGTRRFFSKTNDDEFTFEVDATGRATAMILHIESGDIRLARVE